MVAPKTYTLQRNAGATAAQPNKTSINVTQPIRSFTDQVRVRASAGCALWRPEGCGRAIDPFTPNIYKRCVVAAGWPLCCGVDQSPFCGLVP